MKGYRTRTIKMRLGVGAILIHTLRLLFEEQRMIDASNLKKEIDSNLLNTSYISRDLGIHFYIEYQTPPPH